MPPIKHTFQESTEGTKLDADGGRWAVYGLKYEVDGDKGIAFKHVGINFVQHLTSKTHQNQLHIFSAQMTPHIAQFSAKIAVKQSGRFGEPASSSIFPSWQVNHAMIADFCWAFGIVYFRPAAHSRCTQGGVSSRSASMNCSCVVFFCQNSRQA